MFELLTETNIKKKPTVFGKLKEDLIKAIDDSVLIPGALLPSENILAIKYNISRSSVRLALKELEDEDRILKKPGKGTFVRDNTLVFESKTLNEIKTIGVDLELSEIGDDWYGSKLLNGIEAVCSEHHCRLALARNYDLKKMRKGFFDGFISTSMQPDGYEAFERLTKLDVYPVLFNRITDFEDIAYFSVNYRSESEKAINFLLDKGHQKIGLVSTKLNPVADSLRYQGYCDAMTAKGLEVETDYCKVPPNESDEFYADAIYEFLKSADITAIYLLNGCFALPLFSAIRRLGIKVPEELEIMCFDDVAYTYPIYQYPFTYVKMPLAQMGHDAVEYLLKKFEYNKDVPVQKKLYKAELVSC